MRLPRFFRRAHWDRERARELAAYVEIETQENIARGMTPDDARTAAHRKLGNPTLIREEIYRMNTVTFLDSVWQDLRYGARTLRLNPGFALIAIASLALGIGANTAIFQLIDAVNLRTLPVSRPQELAEVRITDMGAARGSRQRPNALTNPLWEKIRDLREPFSGVFAWGTDDLNFSATGETRLGRGLWVSGEAFDTLGVRPLMGRLFTAADDRRGCGLPGVVISYGFWKSEFGGDPAVLGRTVHLDPFKIPVIGVTPPEFFGLEVGRNFDIALPICSEAVFGDARRGPNGRTSSRLDVGTTWWLVVMGRLNPGWTSERASAYYASQSKALFEATLPSNYPPVSVPAYLAFKLEARPAGTGHSGLRYQYSDPLKMLLAIAGLVLLVACANLANLMLARSSARGREMAVRLAIGASRVRLMRQFLSESLLIAAIGGALGLWLATGLTQLLVALLSTRGNAVFVDLHLDWRVLAFTGGLAIVTCVLFGLAPALRATRTPPGEVLKSGSRGSTAGRERFRVQRILVAVQVALSLTLVVGAMLFVRSLRNLIAVDPGFRQEGVLITNLSLQPLNLSRDRMASMNLEVLDRLRAIPGVLSVGATDIVPLGGNSGGNRVWMEGSTADKGTGLLRSRVGPDYFKALRTPLLAGREFDARDNATSPRVAIVNQSFARQLTNAENPIGRRFWVEATPTSPQLFYEIVGMVRDSKYESLRDDDQPIMYLCLPQESSGNIGRIMIRSAMDLDRVAASVRTVLQEIHPEIRFRFQVFEAQIRDSLLRERLVATLSGFFGALAALLAAAGLYGVISYAAARRTNEIGVRMALGASRGNVFGMILREAAWLTAIGIAAGVGLSIALAQTVRSMLFGLHPSDPLTLLAAVVALGFVAFAASYFPARRAAKLDPMVALREE